MGGGAWRMSSRPHARRAQPTMGGGQHRLHLLALAMHPIESVLLNVVQGRGRPVTIQCWDASQAQMPDAAADPITGRALDAEEAAATALADVSRRSHCSQLVSHPTYNALVLLIPCPRPRLFQIWLAHSTSQLAPLYNCLPRLLSSTSSPTTGPAPQDEPLVVPPVPLPAACFLNGIDMNISAPGGVGSPLPLVAYSLCREGTRLCSRFPPPPLPSYITCIACVYSLTRCLLVQLVKVAQAKCCCKQGHLLEGKRKCRQ
jgi:hypothetical protein